jgi:adenylate cyclase
MLEPAGEVGGDLYDAFMLDKHRFFFLVGDVSGKGVPASLFMALSKALCKSAALRQHVSLDELMILANIEISRENPALLFVTVLAGIMDVRTGEMDLCSAGHDAPILLRAGETPCPVGTVGGPPLCVLEDFPYISDFVQLQPDDMLVMITDGVTEAHDPDQNLYGLERILAYLTVMHRDENGRQSVEAVCHGLYEDVKNFAKDAEASDDITIMAVRFTRPKL